MFWVGVVADTKNLPGCYVSDSSALSTYIGLVQLCYVKWRIFLVVTMIFFPLFFLSMKLIDACPDILMSYGVISTWQSQLSLYPRRVKSNSIQK